MKDWFKRLRSIYRARFSLQVFTVLIFPFPPLLPDTILHISPATASRKTTTATMNRVKIKLTGPILVWPPPAGTRRQGAQMGLPSHRCERKSLSPLTRPSGLAWWSSSEHRQSELWGWKGKAGNGGVCSAASWEPDPLHPSETPHPTPQAIGSGRTSSSQVYCHCGPASKPQEDPKQRGGHSAGKGEEREDNTQSDCDSSKVSEI